MNIENSITDPATVNVSGRDWHLFLAEFESADGKFGFHFYALSHEHAEMLLEELKQTARINGQFGGVVR